MYRALIIEDDDDLATITATHLMRGGYEVVAVGTCTQALEQLSQSQFDLIILDEVLPDMKGDALCAKIRGSCTCPIIFVSCLDDKNTVISALKSGGDDYMIKPVDYGELLARAEAIIRRAGHRVKAESNVTQLRQFSVDTLRHVVIREGERLELSVIEYNILCYLMAHPDTLILYHELYKNVWDSDSLGDVRTVMVHISNLRKKIDPNRTGIIETVRGAGYIFSDV